MARYEEHLFTNVTAEMKTAIAAAVAASGLSQGEWLRRAIQEALTKVPA